MSERLEQIRRWLAEIAPMLTPSATAGRDQILAQLRDRVGSAGLDPETWGVATDVLTGVLLTLQQPPSRDELERAVAAFAAFGLEPLDQDDE